LLGNTVREVLWPDGEGAGAPSPGNCSMNFHVAARTWAEQLPPCLSLAGLPDQWKPRPQGAGFHCLAPPPRRPLQPMQTVVFRVEAVAGRGARGDAAAERAR